MRTFFSIIFAALIAITTVKAQTNPPKDAFEINGIEFTKPLTGTNYAAGLHTDFDGKHTCVFYTDNNATVAYISIDGKIINLKSVDNAEHILTYVGEGCTVTLNVDKTKKFTTPIDATLSVYRPHTRISIERVEVTQLTK